MRPAGAEGEPCAELGQHGHKTVPIGPRTVVGGAPSQDRDIGNALRLTEAGQGAASQVPTEPSRGISVNMTLSKSPSSAALRAGRHQCPPGPTASRGWAANADCALPSQDTSYRHEREKDDAGLLDPEAEMGDHIEDIPCWRSPAWRQRGRWHVMRRDLGALALGTLVGGVPALATAAEPSAQRCGPACSRVIARGPWPAGAPRAGPRRWPSAVAARGPRAGPPRREHAVLADRLANVRPFMSRWTSSSWRSRPTHRPKPGSSLSQWKIWPRSGCARLSTRRLVILTRRAGAILWPSEGGRGPRRGRREPARRIRSIPSTGQYLGKKA